MPKVQLTSQIELDVDELLRGVATLDMKTLDLFTERLLALRARRRAPNLSRSESELLQKINKPVPGAVRERFNLLNEKLQDETISPEEHQEFLQLVDQIELADAGRVQCLLELARLRRVSLDVLLQDLGIHPPAYA
jgi:hypothetical protein